MCFQDVIVIVVVDINNNTWTHSGLGCRPPVPHQDHPRCEVPKGGTGGGPSSADPHLWGPGGEWLSCAELRPGPDPTARGRLQVGAWHQRRHERAGHRHLLCHHGYVLPTRPGVPWSLALLAFIPPCIPASSNLNSLESPQGVAHVPIPLWGHGVSPALPQVGADVPHSEFPIPGCCLPPGVSALPMRRACL